MSSRVREGGRRVWMRVIGRAGRRPDTGFSGAAESAGSSSSLSPALLASSRRINAPSIGAVIAPTSGRAAAKSAARPSALIGG